MIRSVHTVRSTDFSLRRRRAKTSATQIFVTFGFILLLLACLQLTPVQAGQDAEAAPPDVPRFHIVAENLYRGGQPKNGGFEALKEKGVKTIINLREKNEEKATVEKLGMKSVHIPLDAWDRVPDEAIKTFFEILNDPANYPVFIHCQRGADRTGAMVGFYRIAVQGWNAEQAYKEARKIGMRWWYRGLKHQLYEFAEKRRSENGASSKSGDSPDNRK